MYQNNPKKNKSVRRKVTPPAFTPTGNIWSRRGVISALCAEMKFSGTRKSQRNEAKVFRKDPLQYADHAGMWITKRGIIISK